MNHSWKDNICTRCGVKREKKKAKVLKQIVPFLSRYGIWEDWEIYDYKTMWHYGSSGFTRPDCKKVTN